MSDSLCSMETYTARLQLGAGQRRKNVSMCLLSPPPPNEKARSHSSSDSEVFVWLWVWRKHGKGRGRRSCCNRAQRAVITETFRVRHTNSTFLQTGLVLVLAQNATELCSTKHLSEAATSINSDHLHFLHVCDGTLVQPTRSAFIWILQKGNSKPSN